MRVDRQADIQMTDMHIAMLLTPTRGKVISTAAAIKRINKIVVAYTTTLSQKRCLIF